MCVHHILGETCDVLVARLIQLLLDLALHRLDHVVSPVVRVGPFTPSQHGTWLVVINHLLDFEDHLLVIA